MTEEENDTKIGDWDGTLYKVDPTQATKITVGPVWGVKHAAVKAYITSGGVVKLNDIKKKADGIEDLEEDGDDREYDNGWSLTFRNRGNQNVYGMDDLYYADAGSYTISATLKLSNAAGTGDVDKPLSSTFKITDELAGAKPTVTATTYAVESLDSDTVKGVLTTNVDINNNEGVAASVQEVVQKKDPTEKNWNIEGFWVDETVKDVGLVRYYVKVGSWTFNLKA